MQIQMSQLSLPRLSKLSQLTQAIGAGCLVSFATVFSVTAGAHGPASGPKSEADQGPAGLTKLEGADPGFMTQFRQLTYVGPRAGEGYFSADGRQLILQSERHEGNPFYQIYSVDLQSGRTTRLSPGHGKTTCAWFHPNGREALFSSTHLDPGLKAKVEHELAERKNPVKGKYSWSYDEHFDIFATPLKGAPVAEAKLKRLTKELGYDAEASYSPDGKKIVFASNRTGYSEKLSAEDAKLFQQDASYMMEIYLMNADGSGVERLTRSPGYDGGPFFSADGTQITWRRFAPNGAYAEIMVMDLKTRQERQLTRWKAMSWAPYFHPSGDYIIFTSNKLGYSNFELFIVDTAGTREPVRVSFLEGFDGLPVFTPDGQSLSWTRRDEKGESQIHFADWSDAQARRALGLKPAAPLWGSDDVTPRELRAWVEYLAAPEFRGRPSGSEEEKEIANQLALRLKALGLKPAQGQQFVQEFEFVSGVELGAANRARLRLSGKAEDLQVGRDWMPLSLSKVGEQMEASMIFVGHGIVAPAGEGQAAFDSYQGLDVSGRWAVALADLPQNVDLKQRYHLNVWARLSQKAIAARSKGAVGLVVLDPMAREVSRILKFDGASDVGIPVITLSWATAQRMLKDVDLKSLQERANRGEVGVVNDPKASLGVKVDLQLKRSTGRNVLAKLPGRRSQLPPVVVGGHMDHLGMGEVGGSLSRGDEVGKPHVGADDNASGVAAILQLAQALKAGKTLDRDVIFGFWSAEEIGVLGSTQAMKSWQGPRPLAYLNLDMVGRLESGQALQIQGLASSREWRSWFEARQARRVLESDALNLALQDDPYLPTDAVVFYTNEVPVLSFFTGSHADYHRPSDTPEKINYHGLRRVTLEVEAVTKALASQEILPKYQKVEGQSRMNQQRSFRLYLGTVPDYAQEGVKGVRITGTQKASPAEKAGLKSGDVIIELGGIQIESIYDYVYCLQALKAEETVPVKVRRDGRLVELKITPQLKSASSAH